MVFSLVYPEEGSIAETSVKILTITASVLPFLNLQTRGRVWSGGTTNKTNVKSYSSMTYLECNAGSKCGLCFYPFLT